MRFLVDCLRITMNHRRWTSFDRFAQDVSFAARMFSRSPGFAAIVAVTLALGIGASIAAFSVADVVLLRPLPFRDPAGLFALWERPPRTAQWTRQTIPYALVREWQRGVRTFEDITAFAGRDVTLVVGDHPEIVRGDVVGANFFTLLGVRAARGRPILPSDLNAGPVVVLGDELWRTEFGGRPDIVGQPIMRPTLKSTSAIASAMSPAPVFPAKSGWASVGKWICVIG